MHIGILLTTSPEHQNTFTVYQLAASFIRLDHTVDIFLMDDGVFNVLVNVSKRKLFSRFDDLIEKKVNIALCAMSAESRGVKREDLMPGTGYSSQTELSEIVKKCDRFLSFG
ncbi:MAG: DsrE family protein [Nitrospirae bacterium]|nr:DsrE family protein [Nitrospirota bacterium]MBI3605116.1 DsrE family protein [Nitrospirota bacterium]